MANTFNVTPQTIRRDINFLDHQGYVSRYHEGAGLSVSTENVAYRHRKELLLDEKKKIAKAAVNFIRQFKVDIGIIGISGIDLYGTLLDFDFREVHVARTIIENSRKVYLVADHSKFGRNAMVKLGSITEIDTLVTDSPPPKQLMEIMAQHNINLVIP